MPDAFRAHKWRNRTCRKAHELALPTKHGFQMTWIPLTFPHAWYSHPYRLTFARSTSVFAWSLSFLCSIFTLLNLQSKRGKKSWPVRGRQWQRERSDSTVIANRHAQNSRSNLAGSTHAHTYAHTHAAGQWGHHWPKQGDLKEKGLFRLGDGGAPLLSFQASLSHQTFSSKSAYGTPVHFMTVQCCMATLAISFWAPFLIW